MNDHFVCIKVDREERPDVDSIYMEAVQGMTGHGGWPLTAFLDTDAVPFYGGTYFPPVERHGMPSFAMVMEAVAQSWLSQRGRIREASVRIREQLGAVGRIEASSDELATDLLDRAVAAMRTSADIERGGFGSAPKFPPASALELLLARGVTDVVETTLDAMAAGGIHDHLGGGFARYSVDDIWLVPHFEKMLYDNALLARTYLHGFQALGHERWRLTCERTLDWMLAEMRGEEGGFYSALDADSEGVEGRFYVWTPNEIREVLAGAGLDEAADGVIAHYGVSEQGNFEGANILNLIGRGGAQPPAYLDEARRALYEARAKRVWPGLDDKRLLSWNALAIAALAEAGGALERDDYLEAARECAEFVWEHMRGSDGRLLRTWKDGEAKLNAYLEDYAYFVEALLTLYEASFDVRWFDAARETADRMIGHFFDSERGGFFTTSDDHETLIARRKDVDDHPIPSGNSAAAFGLAAPRRAHRRAMPMKNTRFRCFACFREWRIATRRRWDTCSAPSTSTLPPSRRWRWSSARQRRSGWSWRAVVRSAYRPHLVLAGGPEGSERPELMRARTALDGRAAAYVCERFACRAPVGDPAELAAALDG